jgi:hypothetical protein
MEDSSADQHALAQWKLVRSAIEHENTLINYRVSWFMATQLFLFAGFSSIFVKAVEKDELFGMAKVYLAFVTISSIGLYICILAWVNVRAAGKMIGRLRDWWITNFHAQENDFEKWKRSIQFFDGEKRFPPINGIFTENLMEYFGEKRLPVAIAMCWLLLLGLTTAKFFQSCSDSYKPFVWSVAILLALILLALLPCRKTIRGLLDDDNERLLKELKELHQEIHSP